MRTHLGRTLKPVRPSTTPTGDRTADDALAG
jgi:hypothetical protein